MVLFYPLSSPFAKQSQALLPMLKKLNLPQAFHRLGAGFIWPALLLLISSNSITNLCILIITFFVRLTAN